MEPADCLSHRPYKQHTQSEEQLKTFRKEPNDTIIKKSSHIKTLLVSSRLFFVSYFYFSPHCDGDVTPNTLDQVCRRRISPSSDLKLTNMYEESARRMHAGLDEKREKELSLSSSHRPFRRHDVIACNNGDIARAKRPQGSTMGKKIWLSTRPKKL